ncbi:hypothetical protein HJFPF1_04294 [Paramyrothecium foliicola]|nr:hypothetical protein HJFPF1_04294 [Paramyrothecium foliicola]
MPSFSRIFSSLLAASALAMASPISQEVGGSTRINPRAGGPHIPAQRVYPNYYNLYPQSPDRFDGAVDHFTLESWGGLSQIEQIMEFKNIPAGAKTCQIHFELDVQVEPFFTGDGALHFINIDRFGSLSHDGRVSWNAISPYLAGLQHIGAFDLADWDNSASAARSVAHFSVDCAPAITFKFSYGELCSEKSLDLVQGVKSGLFLRYDL